MKHFSATVLLSTVAVASATNTTYCVRISLSTEKLYQLESQLTSSTVRKARELGDRQPGGVSWPSRLRPIRDFLFLD